MYFSPDSEKSSGNETWGEGGRGGGMSVRGECVRAGAHSDIKCEHATTMLNIKI